LPGGKVLVTGGLSGNSYLSRAELYDPTNGTWTPIAPMSTNRAFHTATLLPNGAVLVAGGRNSSTTAISKAELYDPVAGTWTVTGTMNVPRRNQTTTLLPAGT